MTHFAIPDGVSSAAQAELASMLGNGSRQLSGFAPLGLVFIARDSRVTALLIATVVGFDADGWWSR